MVEGCAVGRTVHYINPEGKCVAAIIGQVEDKELGLVSLHIFDYVKGVQLGILHRYKVLFSSKNEKDTWHWPERS